MIPYSTQNISKKDTKEVLKTLKSSFLTQGPKVIEFEKKISNEVNSRYAVATNSATSALHISCMALGFSKNDILWTVPNTFVASANCALHLGGRVDFVDIDYLTGNIDLEILEKKLYLAKRKNLLPKILVPVHFSGMPTDQDLIFKLSRKYKFSILEDASHSIGAKYKNQKVGSCKWSDITIFSFHPVKIITTIEGGIALTNKKKIYEKLKLYMNHGITRDQQKFKYKNKKKWYYEQQVLGLNYRMTDVAATLGISQLERLKNFVEKRNLIAKKYKKFLDKKFLYSPIIVKNKTSSFHLYVIKLKKKFHRYHEDLFNYLRNKKINVNVHYIPVHLHPYYRNLGFRKGDFKMAELHAKTSISIPIFPHLKINKVKLISDLINNYLKKRDK